MGSELKAAALADALLADELAEELLADVLESAALEADELAALVEADAALPDDEPPRLIIPKWLRANTAPAITARATTMPMMRGAFDFFSGGLTLVPFVWLAEGVKDVSGLYRKGAGAPVCTSDVISGV